MQLDQYKPGDEAAILELFKTTFRQEMSLAYWQWRFQQNPYGREWISLMWDGEVLAGHYAVSPVMLQVGEEAVLTALSMTTMTHPDYTGRGIFTTLAENLYARLAQDHQVAAVWGFPNTNSHYGFIKNLGWQNVSLLSTLSLSVDQLKKGGTVAIQTGVVQFQEGHERAFHACNHFAVSTLKSKEYLNWRYLQNPQNQYTIFEYRQGDMYYFAVAKLYQPAQQATELDVVELHFPAESELLAGLFSYMAAHFQEQAPAKINLWLPLNDPRHILLEKLGFRHGLPLTYLGLRDFSGQFHNRLDGKDWFLSMGDSDIY